MAIRGFEKKDPLDSFNQLLQVINQIDSMGDRKNAQDIQFSNALQSNIRDVRTLEDLNNLLPNVNNHNENLKISGNEQYSVQFSDKEKAFVNANSAYEKAKLIQDQNLANPDMLAKDLLTGGWEGATAGILEIDNLLDDLDEGDAYKFRYAGNDKYSQTSLRNALETRKKSYKTVLEILDNPENAESFLVVNPDGSMDDDTAMLFDKLKFNIVTGDVQEVESTIKTGVSEAISSYNKYENAYIRWNRLHNKVLDNKSSFFGGAVTASDLEGEEGNEGVMQMLLANGLDESSPLDDEFIRRMMLTSLDLLKKSNQRHKVFTGKLYNENPFYKEYDEETLFGDLDSMGMSEKKVVIDDINPKTEENIKKGEISPITKTTEVTTAEQSKVKPDVGSQRYKENEQANVRLNFVNSVLPEVTLKETKRGQTVRANWIDNNEETMYDDVDKISKIIGSQSETFSRTDKNISSQQHKNVTDLYEKYLGRSEALVPLRRLIEQYNKLGGRTAAGTKKIRLAKKILTRYNTIKNKITEKAKRF